MHDIEYISPIEYPPPAPPNPASISSSDRPLSLRMAIVFLSIICGTLLRGGGGGGLKYSFGVARAIEHAFINETPQVWVLPHGLQASQTTARTCSIWLPSA